MNVASLELCKELYELSGWESPPRQVWVINEALLEDTGVKPPANFPRLGYGKKSGAITYWPAYDLGYLLRKLPYKLPDTRVNFWLHISMGSNSAVALYGNVEDNQPTCRADTPEDAAAKLAIELLKSGVLTSEHKGSSKLAQ